MHPLIHDRRLILPATPAHVAESSLTRAVGTATPHPGDPSHGTSGTLENFKTYYRINKLTGKKLNVSLNLLLSSTQFGELPVRYLTKPFRNPRIAGVVNPDPVGSALF
jgi:hypothetical protein